MKRISRQLENALYEFLNMERVTQPEMRALVRMGLVRVAQDETSGYMITEAGWEYLYRVFPEVHGTFVPGPKAFQAGFRTPGEEATREEYLEAWEREMGSGWAEEIRKSDSLQ